MKLFALNQLFLHGHIVSPAALSALGLLERAAEKPQSSAILDASKRNTSGAAQAPAQAAPSASSLCA